MSTPKFEFILTPHNLKERDFELVGREAIDLGFLVRENIPIPPSFIISTLAFDNFVVENNLVGPIAKHLKKVRPFIKQSAVEASHEIKKLIMEAEIGSKLMEELTFAYQKLTANNENPIVTMVTSNIIEEKYIPVTSYKPNETLLQGVQDLFIQIKKSWATLFSEEALEFRANSYYKEEISVALIIQKLIRAEVSGYGNSATVFSKEEMDVKAIYGVETQEFNTLCDTYTVDKKNYKVINKHIVPQNHMFIHELKPTNNNKFIKVELSETWKKNPKLDDETVVYISKIVKKIENLFRQDVTVKWGIETGELFVMSLDPLILPEIEHKVEKITEKPVKIEPKIVKEKEPDIEKLAEEVLDIVEGKEEAPLLEEEIPEIKEQAIELPLLKKDKEPEDGKIKYMDDFIFESGLYLDISKMNSKHLSALHYFSGSFYDGTEMILNNNILPEEYATNQKVLISLLEKYSLDLSTASRCAIHKPMIYQLSTISQMELKLLGISENKYKYNLDERFIDYPESLGIEIMAIKKSRQQHNARNIHVSISGLRNLSNLEDIEKLFNTSGLKRATSFRIYAEVCVPSFIFELDRIQKNRIDGIIVNYSKLLKALTFRSEIREVDHTVGMHALDTLKRIAHDKNMEFIVRFNTYNDELIKFTKSLKPQSIVFSTIPTEDTLKLIGTN